MEKQTQENKIDVLIQNFVIDYEKGLFTFEEFLQSLKKVLSDIFIDKIVEKVIFRTLLHDVLECE